MMHPFGTKITFESHPEVELTITNVRPKKMKRTITLTITGNEDLSNAELELKIENALDSIGVDYSAVIAETIVQEADDESPDEIPE